jgi:uncharacterized protein YggE
MRNTGQILLLLALFGFSPAIAETPAPRPATVSVAGMGEAELKPDFARIRVMVGTQADTIAQVTEANRTASEQVLKRLQALGVKPEDIRTVNLQVFQTPPRVGPDGRELKTPRFTANHQLRIISRKIDEVGRLASEILAVDNLSLQSVAWSLDRQAEGEDQARREAVRDAKRQAEIYAAAAGVSLGRLVEIRDGVVQALGGEEQTYGDMSSARKALAGAIAEPLPVVPPATIRYTATVQMVWEIAP